MSKNVMITVSLFDNIYDVLIALEPFVPDEIRTDYLHVLWDINMKRHKMDLREAYSKLISAETTDARDWARIEYLRLKAHVEDSFY